MTASSDHPSESAATVHIASTLASLKRSKISGMLDPSVGSLAK
jgi:hypothetical protein